MDYNPLLPYIHILASSRRPTVVSNKTNAKNSNFRFSPGQIFHFSIVIPSLILQTSIQPPFWSGGYTVLKNSSRLYAILLVNTGQLYWWLVHNLLIGEDSTASLFPPWWFPFQQAMHEKQPNLSGLTQTGVCLCGLRTQIFYFRFEANNSLTLKFPAVFELCLS